MSNRLKSNPIPFAADWATSIGAGRVINGYRNPVSPERYVSNYPTLENAIVAPRSSATIQYALENPIQDAIVESTSILNTATEVSSIQPELEVPSDLTPTQVKQSEPDINAAIDERSSDPERQKKKKRGRPAKNIMAIRAIISSYGLYCIKNPFGTQKDFCLSIGLSPRTFRYFKKQVPQELKKIEEINKWHRCFHSLKK